ncbi:MAG TPA: DUF2252 domain-containing protein [Puia sp.]|jgi:uncharacterized protein (DUF2252 family)
MEAISDHEVETRGEMKEAFIRQLSHSEQRERGKYIRKSCPRMSHKVWKARKDRTDPVSLIEKANVGRMPDLIPIRHGRMVASPFTFYRGAAAIMASDLSTTPNTGIRVQCCGDAHLSNFGGFGTPERRVIFSINDLDETLPAPFEWDLKRLTASFVVASRNNKFKESDARDMALACARSYRNHMVEFSEMSALELWSFSLQADKLLPGIKDPAIRNRALKRLAKESASSVADDIFPKLAGSNGDSYFIRDQLPVIFHMPGHTPGQIADVVSTTFKRYKETLSPAARVLIDRYEIKDAAIKVVGVGSVGTMCWVLLLMDNGGTPLFLQVKEANASVLESYAGPSIYGNHGERVVNGQRLIQPYSDIFLGWMQGTGEYKKHFYVRQLRDIKIKVLVESFGKNIMELYADWCGHAMALSHARSGDADLLRGYMGKTDEFDEALASFSVSYADQNEKDYQSFKRAIRDGRIKAEFEKTK